MTFKQFIRPISILLNIDEIVDEVEALYHVEFGHRSPLHMRRSTLAYGMTTHVKFMSNAPLNEEFKYLIKRVCTKRSYSSQNLEYAVME